MIKLVTVLLSLLTTLQGATVDLLKGQAEFPTRVIGAKGCGVYDFLPGVSVDCYTPPVRIVIVNVVDDPINKAASVRSLKLINTSRRQIKVPSSLARSNENSGQAFLEFKAGWDTMAVSLKAVSFAFSDEVDASSAITLEPDNSLTYLLPLRLEKTKVAGPQSVIVAIDYFKIENKSGDTEANIMQGKEIVSEPFLIVAPRK